jgi:chromosome segregation ATPase
MTTVTNDLIYEVLKSVQAQVAVIREDVNSIKTRLTSQDRLLSQIQSGFAGLHGDFAELSGRMDRLESRLERVENRLNIADVPH